MKRFYRTLMAIFVAIAAFTPVSAQDCLYLVGNISDWTTPSSGNEAYYEDFKLTQVGEFYGYPIMQGSFDVSSLQEAPMFRFYTALEGWGGNSLGSQYWDEPLDFSLQQIENGLNLTQGKGSFNITDWSGNTLYITVWNMMVWASNSQFFDPSTVPTLNDMELFKLCAGEDGIYSVYIHFNSNYVKVKGSVVGRPDKEWLYIAPKSSLLPDDYGIAVSGFDFSETPVNFECPVQNGSTSKLYVDLLNKKLYLNSNQSRWLSGSFNDCPPITFDNYKNYDQYLLNARTYNQIMTEIPPGQISIILFTPSFGEDYYDYVNWDVERELSYWSYSDSYFKLNWPGGILVANINALGRIESMDNMFVSFRNQSTPAVKLEQTAAGIFEGVVSVPEGIEPENLYILFQDYSFNAPCLAVRNIDNFFEGLNKSRTGDYEVIPQSACISFSQFPDGGKIKVVVNKNNMTVSFTPVDGEVQNIPLFTNDYYDDTVQYPFDRFDRNIFLNFITNDEGSGYERTTNHRIEMSDGSILIPDWNSGVSDGLGKTVYSYSLMTADEIPEEAFLSVSKPAGILSGESIFQVNVANNELSIYQSDESFTDRTVTGGLKLPKCLYLYGSTGGTDYSNINSITGEQFMFTFGNCSDNILVLTSYDSASECGVYEGKFSIMKDYPYDYTNIYLTLYPLVGRYNYSPSIFGGYENIMYPDESDVFSIENGSIRDYARTAFMIKTKDAPSNDYGIRVSIYGNDKVHIWVGNGAATVKEIEINNHDAIGIAGEKGSIRIDSLTGTQVSVYSVNGSLIRSVNVPAGSTRLEGFLPGVYIVNGQKVLVR